MNLSFVFIEICIENTSVYTAAHLGKHSRGPFNCTTVTLPAELRPGENHMEIFNLEVVRLL